MKIDVARFPKGKHVFAQPAKIHGSLNSFHRLRIGRLDPDFQLDQGRSKTRKERNLFLSEEVRSYLKVEVRNSVVMVRNILPDLHRPLSVTVKGPVHELDLRNLVVNEKLKFPLYGLHVAKTNRLINRRQAVSAAERASAARFVVDDAVVEQLNIIIEKGDCVHIRAHLRTDWIIDYTSSILPYAARESPNKLPDFLHFQVIRSCPRCIFYLRVRRNIV